jgi:uncharacterized protein
MGVNEVIGDKRDEILRLTAKYGVSNVRVFGSVARGEAKEDSDIDFLVTVQEGTSVFKLVGLWLELKELVGREVSLVDDEAIDGDFEAEAIRDVMPL